MALRAMTILSRNCQCPNYSRINIASAYCPHSGLLLSQQQRNYNNEQNKKNDNSHYKYGGKWNGKTSIAVGFGVSTAAVIAGISANSLLAEENKETPKETK